MCVCVCVGGGGGGVGYTCKFGPCYINKTSISYTQRIFLYGIRRLLLRQFEKFKYCMESMVIFFQT